MKAETLKLRLLRYVDGTATAAEKRQIQDWLSASNESALPFDEAQLAAQKQEILWEIQAETRYPEEFGTGEKPWWQKISAFF